MTIKSIGGGRSQLLRSAGSNVGMMAAGQYVAAGLALATAMTASRLLGPEGYGQAALIMTFPSLLLSIGSFKSGSVATRYSSLFRATGDSELLKAISKLGYTVDLGVSAGVFLVVLIAGQWVTEWVYGAPWLFWSMVAYAFSYLFVAFRGTSLAILSAFEEFRRLSILVTLERGAALVAVVCLLWTGFGVNGLVLGMAISNVLAGSVSLVMAWSVLRRSGVGPWWQASLKGLDHLRGELLSLFGWNYVMTTLGGVVTQAPVILLGIVRGPEEAGFFRLALALATCASYPAGAASQVLYPRLSARQASRAFHGHLAANWKRWIIRAGLPMAVAISSLALFLPWLLPIVLGEGYRGMVAGAQMLLLAAAVEALFFWLYPYYYASGRVSAWTKAFAVHTGWVLLLGSLATLQWGFAGMAAALGIGKIILHVLMCRAALTGKGVFLRNETADLERDAPAARP
jgi:O-antigen/teichoic acid export membrane protein